MTDTQKFFMSGFVVLIGVAGTIIGLELHRPGLIVYNSFFCGANSVFFLGRLWDFLKRVKITFN